TKQIQRLFKDRAKLIRQHINIDDMLSTSKQIAKVRKPMSANYRKDFGGHRLSASFVRIPVAEAANASGSSPIVAIDSSNTTTDTNNNNKNNNNNNNKIIIITIIIMQIKVILHCKKIIIGNVSELLHAGKFYQDLTRKLCNVVVMEMIGLVEFYVTSLNRKLELAGKVRIYSNRSLSPEPVDNELNPRSNQAASFSLPQLKGNAIAVVAAPASALAPAPAFVPAPASVPESISAIRAEASASASNLNEKRSSFRFDAIANIGTMSPTSENVAKLVLFF
ncbi:hypothetical protein RFI_02277, partial [Reticulomyxa filosa]